MNKFVDYAGNDIIYVGCPACEYAKHKFEVPCGMVYEDKYLTVTQDWELPIPGMMIVSPKRHVEYLSELTPIERNHVFSVVNDVIIILRREGFVSGANVIFEEKKDRHLHVWILPRDGWKERGVDPTKDIRELQRFAIENMKTVENITKINNIAEILRKNLSNR